MINNEYPLLGKMTKIFYRGCHNFSLSPEDVKDMSWDWQQKFLKATVNSTLLQKYPISRQFSKLFFKKLIGHLETESQEVHDDMYSHLCLAMENTGESFSYRHYLINTDGNEIVTIRETNKMVVNGTTGMRTWEAALMLADWSLCNKELFAHKNILELGSGVGFTGITIGKLCDPQSIYLSDCHPEVLRAISDNIRINFPESQEHVIGDVTLYKCGETSIGTLAFDWNNLEDLPDDMIPDLLIGADIVYDPSILQPLCEVLRAFFNRNKKLDVYIASVIRNVETFKSFLKTLDDMNLTYQKLSQPEFVYIEWGHDIEKCLLKINL